jgi:hypothetical protein
MAHGDAVSSANTYGNQAANEHELAGRLKRIEFAVKNHTGGLLVPLQVIHFAELGPAGSQKATVGRFDPGPATRPTSRRAGFGIGSWGDLTDEAATGIGNLGEICRRWVQWPRIEGHRSGV